MTFLTLRFLLLAGLLLALTGTALAETDASVLRQRMEARLPAIDRLKAQQLLGENNRGLLEWRAAVPNERSGQLVEEENRDRRAVYVLLARQTGGTPEAVARLRARNIAKASAPGIWIQHEDGNWYLKE